MWDEQKNHLYKKSAIVVTMVLLATISTSVAFRHGQFQINPDGIFHLTRFESIYQALAAGSWPSRLNFIGFEHQGAAVTGMYPWLSAIMFILPRFFVSQMWTFAIGFFILNLLTIVFTWCLMKRFTNQPRLIWLGVLLYQFNGYHFILMYSRVAIGEAIGYMALPLILLGLVDIWHNRQYAWVSLGIGMAIVANGHLLSLVLCTIMVVVFESYRLIKQKMTWLEVKSLIKSALLAGVLSIYSLGTVLQIMRQNTLMPPSIRWDPMTLPHYIGVTLTNNFQEYRDTTMGFAIGVILCVFLFFAMRSFKAKWARWILVANIILLGTFDFILGPQLINSPLSTLQFSMRFLTFVALFLAIGIVMYFESRPKQTQQRWWIYGLMTSVFLCGTIGVIQNFTAETKSDYTKVLSEKTYATCIAQHKAKDYVLRDATVNLKTIDFNKPTEKAKLYRSMLYDPRVKNDFTYQGSTFDSVTWTQHTRHAKQVKLPVIGYQGVNYDVQVNGQSVPYSRSEGHLSVLLAAGHNTIVIFGR